jgi:hypothetical protein
VHWFDAVVVGNGGKNGRELGLGRTVRSHTDARQRRNDRRPGQDATHVRGNIALSWMQQETNVVAATRPAAFHGRPRVGRKREAGDRATLTHGVLRGACPAGKLKLLKFDKRSLRSGKRAILVVCTCNMHRLHMFVLDIANMTHIAPGTPGMVTMD